MSIFGDSKHDRHEEHLEREEVRLLREIKHTLHEIKDILAPKLVAQFIITQGDSSMPTQGPLLGIAPGLSDVFTATPVDASGNALPVPAGNSVVTTSDDPTDTITPSSADGTQFSVSVSSAASPGSFHTLTSVLATAQSDGSNGSTPNSLPILGTAPATLVSGFVVTQGAATPAAAKASVRR